MTDNRKIEDAWAIISGGRITSVRFSFQVATAEANLKGGQVRKAKIIYLDEPVEPPKEKLKETMETESKPVAELWNQE